MAKRRSLSLVYFLKGIALGLAIILVAMIGGGFWLWRVYSGSIVPSSPQKAVIASNQPLVSPTATPTPDPLAPFTVLLLGYGGGRHSGGRLSDTMIVAHINPRTKFIHLISLPRDMWVDLPVLESGTRPFKINHAYAIGFDDGGYPNKPAVYRGAGGGGTLAKYAASLVTGLQIDYFASVSFEGFTRGVDKLGGVEVTVPVTFTDPFYPIAGNEDELCDHTEEEVEALTATLSGELLDAEFPCRYEALHYDAGRQHMDGASALRFVRSRHSKEHGGDFNRGIRQQAFIRGVREKVLTINFIPKAFPVINELGREVETDITPGILSEKLQVMGELGAYELKSIGISTANVLTEGYSADRQYILMPEGGEGEWGVVHEFVKSELSKE